MKLESLLNDHREKMVPLFHPEPSAHNTLKLDLSASNHTLSAETVGNSELLREYIWGSMRAKECTYAYGGYLEDRSVYRRSKLFGDDKNARTIHLGTDIWCTAGAPVHTPLDGSIHSFQNNANHGDYGPTIILTHILDGVRFHTLYGHLSADSLTGLECGRQFSAGEVLCRVGRREENGDWPPHLHFQVIADMNGKSGDFPGVASLADLPLYKLLCPNPIAFFHKLQKL